MSLIEIAHHNTRGDIYKFVKDMRLVLLLSLFLLMSASHPNAIHGQGHTGTHVSAHSGHTQGHASQIYPIANNTIAGTDRGCKHIANYVTTSIVSVPMCIGQTDQDLKNGMSIINVITSRGYLPTCRVMHLMLWMASEVSPGHRLNRDHFVDIGANIGSCSVHMASLGFPVISVEPVQEHVNTIQGTIDINPSFHVELNHIGMAIESKSIHANFGHGARNWGATEFHEVSKDEKFETELKLETLEQVVGSRRVALLKVDCEGCEWAAIKGARRLIRRIPMIKIEVVQNTYEAGNETVTPKEMLQYLQDHGFDLFTDMWEEQNLYFGRRPNDILEIDRLFGSKKFNIGTDEALLNESAKRILSNPINATNFDRNAFLKRATDVIAIEKVLALKMKMKWLQ